MVGSIDPRCETIRGTHWPVKVAGVFGTRVAENHLGQRSTNRTNRPDIWMQAIRSDHRKTLAARGPSTYGSRRSPGRRTELGRRAHLLQKPRQIIGDMIDMCGVAAFQLPVLAHHFLDRKSVV